jgi:hypothetical protein
MDVIGRRAWALTFEQDYDAQGIVAAKLDVEAK